MPARPPSPRSVAVVLAVVASSFGTGCALHTQAPVREVAYDFSDADFYDRHYAPSPDYRSEDDEPSARAPGRRGVLVHDAQRAPASTGEPVAAR